ncbi:MAG: hypothetical protein HYZ96_03010 [Candidatus Omnitrophica bacterium]|nr:hypothetical protein [Candidatus Omnitrophota bacterium]
MLNAIGMVAAVLLPLWNIPLIIRLQRRKSSQDVSLWWAFGVWGCLLLMLPAGLRSPDAVFRVFAVANLALFSLVVLQVLRYRA